MPTIASLTRIRASLAVRQTPALIWHGADGERIELSGRVTENWIAKTAGLLSEEFDAGPDLVLRLRLSTASDSQLHWRSMIFAAAAWTTGSEALFAGPEPHWDETVPPGSTARVVDVVADHDGRLLAGPTGPAEDVIGVALPGLALRGDLPAGTTAFDYTSEVRGHPDVFTASLPGDLGDPASDPGADDTSGAGFLAPWRPDPGEAGSHGLPPGAVRLLLGALGAGCAVGFTDLREAAAVRALFTAEGMAPHSPGPEGFS